MSSNLVRYILLAGLILAAVASATYASGMSGSAKALGGTGNLEVLAPTGSTVQVTWQTFNASSQVTVARVTWTPAESANYRVEVHVYNASGSLITSGTATVTGSGTSLRSDNVTLAAPASISAIASVHVPISQTN